MPRKPSPRSKDPRPKIPGARDYRMKRRAAIVVNSTLYPRDLAKLALLCGGNERCRSAVIRVLIRQAKPLPIQPHLLVASLEDDRDYARQLVKALPWKAKLSPRLSDYFDPSMVG